MSEIKSEDQVVWLDLETSGLSPKDDVIMEVGVLVPERFPDRGGVVEWSAPIYNHPQDLRMNEYVRKMHGRTGLTARCETNGMELRRAEEKIMALLIECGIKPGQGILAGSSIHFDRAFIATYMPGLDRMLSHRMIDVSSLRLVLKSLDFEAYKRLQTASSPPDHSVMSDIKGSIAEAKAVIEALGKHYLATQLATQFKEIQANSGIIVEAPKPEGQLWTDLIKAVP